MYYALLLEKNETDLSVSVKNLPISHIPKNDVVIDVHYSALNYKDALAITGQAQIIKQYPLTPGIDCAGVVVQSHSPQYPVGCSVILTGWGIGERYPGGLAQKISAKADWLVPLPETLTLKQSMILGTPALTAMLCVTAIEESGITPEKGEIVVTGASGAVGNIAIVLLSQLGFEVTAVTHRLENSNYLQTLGAKHVLLGKDFQERSAPLEKQLWAGVIDTLGGTVLAKLLAQTKYGGCVAACGLAADFKLPTTVMPFILRNIRLQGVDSVMLPVAKRVACWQRLASLFPKSYYDQISQEISLDEVIPSSFELLNRKLTGRIIVQL